MICTSFSPCVTGDEIEIVVECYGNRNGEDSSTSAHESLSGQGLHGSLDRGNASWGRANAPASAAPRLRHPVVRFRKIAGEAPSAAVRPGDWHRLQLTAATARGGGAAAADGRLAANRSLRFFAELGNGATAELLVGK